ncbi:putative small oligopeptide opt family protein [Neofusicoccum parvum UCRNP2]|uniref:Putative small oligopeptide opt family protein n=1 Tax=Botryosphaeria parva (strain UCR-NP2) TaxID=1287680 RepID=R1EEX1_BOTPV|nr:putative small oligopeptide opt family protein [Neofusicoccum parvum UCRNP2]
MASSISDAERPSAVDEKKEPVIAGQDVEPGHLQELEVDIAEALNEGGKEFDLDADHSPYPEVRAVVPEVDDPAIPVNTLRMWIIGFAFTMIGSGVNNFFSLRYPSVHIVALVAELLAYPCGIFLAHILPIWTLNLGPMGKWCINPDRHFNIKEHTVITIMSNVSIGFGSADATSIIQAASKFYGFPMRAGFNVLLVLCCQLLGFGVAGLSAPWLVEPANIIWPGTLSICALLSTLHSRANAMANGWSITRLRFFMYAMAGAFVFWWFPGLMFVALSYFTWVCWIAPKNRVVNQLFGMQTGLGLSPITFDWTQIAYNTNPLLSPSWAALNVFFGFVGAFWIVVPAIYYTNTWWTGYLPLMTADVYDRTGAAYNVTQLLNDDGSFNAEKYAGYSPPYLGASFAFVYGLSFASITSVLVHVGLWHGKDIWQTLRVGQKLDIHGRLMQSYRKTPWWWYAVVTVATVALSIAMVEVYDTLLPVYGVFLGLLIPAIYMIPCGIIQGITNVDAQQINVLSEFIGGYMFQGKPLANMIFKVLSQDVVQQGIFFAQDMKLGHYMKVSPRLVFAAQGSATVLGALTQVGVTTWIVGKIYSKLLHFFWIGALMPLLTWAAWKYTKKDYLKKVNWPLIFVGTYNVPPATGINYSSWAVVNYIFNHWLKRKFFAWWTKYNYVLAAALDTGTALAGIIIFFCVTYPGGVFPDWWGNTVYLNTADADGVPYLDMPAQGWFGYANGTWS